MKKLIFIVILLALLSFSLIQGQQENFNILNPQPSIKNIKVELKNPLILNPNSARIITIKKTPIPFKPFDFSFFKITKDQIITLENGVKIKGEEFLKEINDIEKKLNDLGYSLRDKEEEIVIQRIVIKREDLEMQKKLFKNITPFATFEMAQKEEPLKEFKNLNFERKWELPLGDDEFNINLSTGLTLRGEENQVLANTYAIAKAGLLGYRTEVIKIEGELKSTKNEEPNNGTLKVYILGRKEYEKSFKTKYRLKEDLNYNIDWGFPITAPVGPFNIKGTFGIRGSIKLSLDSSLDLLLCSASINPSIDTKAFAEVGIDYKVASAGVGGELTILKDTLVLNGSLGLVMQEPIYNSYFNILASGENSLNALSGSFYFFVKVNYLVGSKKFKTEIYNWDGFSWNTRLFNYSYKEPAYKDKTLWLVIKDIKGITPYTARNEKTNITSKNFYVEAEVGGQIFSTVIPDKNADGIADSDWRLRIPLSSRTTEIPIKIRVLQEYSTKSLNFKNILDLCKGEEKEMEIKIDLNSNNFTGTINGKLEQEYTSVGDFSYFGEKFHSIDFKITSKFDFEPAPSKAK
ncbi:MAG: hypothetical protein N2516_04735 [Dictyoglomaceae bacterium]|nr:hypothetical protein [Dictyoglomaceae bacterium]